MIFLTLLVLPLLQGCTTSADSVSSGIRMEATRIIDGDTFDGLSDGQTYRIRLNAIDAPERGQPYYRRSKDMLGQLCSQGPLRVELLEKDRYGRWIGRVFDRRERHINALMISEGMAWHYVKYSNDESLTAMETEARIARRGLWADEQPVAPWLHRQQQRKSKK